MDPAAAVTPESFDLLTIFVRADWVVKLVMIGLAIASLWSWTIILDKMVRFAALNREADRFEDQVASGRSLEDVAADAGDRPTHALPRMLQGALKEWREARVKGPPTEVAPSPRKTASSYKASVTRFQYASRKLPTP